VEKIDNGIKIKLPPLRVYKDEIDAIFDILLEVSNGAISIETCGFRLENPDDISKIQCENTHHLVLHSSKPYIRIELLPSYGEIYAASNNLKTRGAVSSIIEVLLQSKVNLPEYLNSYLFALLLGGGFGFAVMQDDPLILFISTGLLLAFLLWRVWYYYFTTGRYNTIIFTTRSTVRNKLLRNWEDLIKYIIAAILGAVVGAVVQVLISFLMK